jgi:3-hydroxyisobutyrate dehydrogenase-like beta-hydroxyacid dehydrogenase
VIHSTVHPDTCRRLAQAASAAGATLIDAPVSGGGQAASERRLLVMVGGEDEDFARALPMLATFGNPVLHLGPLGAGQTAKALNNLLFTAHLGSASALFELARSLKIDREALAQAITHGSARSYALELVARSGFTLESFAGHVAGLLAKDVGIVSQLAEEAAASPEVLRAAAESALREMRS